MDDIDRAILRTLQRSPDLSIDEIGAAVRLSHTPVWRRIQRMHKQGVLLGRYYRIDRRQVGLKVIVFASIKLDRHDEPALLQFEQAVRDKEEIQECHSMTGSFDYMIKILVPDVESFEKLLKTSILHLPHVKDIRSGFALREIKKAETLPL
jgi:DNA-binding Lrp family transcriptional regulator